VAIAIPTRANAARRTVLSHPSADPVEKSGRRGVVKGVAASHVSPSHGAASGAAGPGESPGDGGAGVGAAGVSVGAVVSAGPSSGLGDDGPGAVGAGVDAPMESSIVPLPELVLFAASRWIATMCRVPSGRRAAVHDHAPSDTIAWHTEADPANTVTVAPSSPVPANRVFVPGRTEPLAGLDSVGGSGTVRSRTNRIVGDASERDRGA
jgi:hypothetical protein